MKKKINVAILKSGSENSAILQMIGYMNEGEKQFSARDMEGYLNCRVAQYPSVSDYSFTKSDEQGEVYHVSEDGGKTFTLTLEWIEVHELINQEN